MPNSAGQNEKNGIWSSPQAGVSVLVTDASTINLDMSKGNNFDIPLNVAGSSRTLGIPTGMRPGQQGVINFIQTQAGGNALAFSAQAWSFIGEATPSLTTTGASVGTGVYNVRRYIPAGIFTASGANGSAIITASVAHGLQERDKFTFTTTPPTGFATSTQYYVHVLSSTTFNLASSLANLRAGTYITATSTVSGVGCQVLDITLAINNLIG